MSERELETEYWVNGQISQSCKIMEETGVPFASWANECIGLAEA